MSHFVCRQFNFPSFHLLWSDDGRSLPLLYHPTAIGHPFPPLSSWFSWAAIRTLFALSISARREAQWSKPRQAWGEERRRGERTSGGTENEGGGGRTKGKDEGCCLVLLCTTFSGASSPGEDGGKARHRQKSRKSKMEGRKRGIQRITGISDEQSEVSRMRCWWEKDPVSVFPDQFYQVSVKSRSCFPEHPYSQEQNTDSKGRVCVCARVSACMCVCLCGWAQMVHAEQDAAPAGFWPQGAKDAPERR